MQSTPAGKPGVGEAIVPRLSEAPLLNEAQTLQVLFGPSRLIVDHSFEGLRRKGPAGPVKRDGHTPTIWTAVVLMGTGLSVQHEAVP